jgi:hypothetical protein
MMTSSSTFPQRLTKIDDLIRPDHSYLTDVDSCYFLGEYTARKGYAFSPGNNLVLNFKKSVATRGTAQWQHKERAIQEIAAAFRSALPEKFLNTVTLVPIPPSKAKTDPLYDDRLTRMLRAIRENPPLDVRELIMQASSTAAVHDHVVRPQPEDIARLYTIDRRHSQPAPTGIALCDDVLTTGAHYRAALSVMQQAFPGVRIIGLFIARRVPEAMDFEDFDA